MRGFLAIAMGIALAATFAGLRGPNAAAVAAPVGALPDLPVGSELYPVANRYEPGDVATLVGYVGRSGGGGIEDGPFYAYLSPSGGFGREIYIGAMTITETGHEGWRALRVRISFPVPADLEAGPYTLRYCNDPCTGRLGDLVGGTVAIGVDPEPAVVRFWSLDEPEIARVAQDAVIAGPGYEARASVIRGDLLVPPAPVPLPVAVPAVAAPHPVPDLPPARPPGPGPAVNGGWLVLGAVFAALCVVSVLLALRRGDPAGRMATP